VKIASSPPTHQPLAQLVTTEHVQQFLDILKSLGTKQGPLLSRIVHAFLGSSIKVQKVYCIDVR
jgi:hypothetical protein